MKTWKFASSSIALAALFASLAVPLTAQTWSFRFTDLGRPFADSMVASQPRINAHGAVVYTAKDLYGEVAYYTAHGRTQRIPTLRDGTGLAGNHNVASDINDDAVIVGFSRISDQSSAYHAFTSPAARGSRDISPPHPTNPAFITANRVTNNGLVLLSGGEVYTLADGSFHALATYLPTGGILLGVSNDGDFLSTLDGVLYRSRDGVHTPVAGTLTGSVCAVNDRGDVLSQAGDTLYLLQAGRQSALGELNDAEAQGLNDRGVVIGTFSSEIPLDPDAEYPDDRHAFAFLGGKLVDLNNHVDPRLGFTLATAEDINDRGQITGIAYAPDGSYRAYVLTPVPEPATYAMAAAFGLAFAIAQRWRRSSSTRRSDAQQL